MNNDQIIQLLFVLFGSGGLLTSLILWRSQAKKVPVDRQEAQVSQALAVSSAATIMYATVTARLSAQDVKVDAQDQKIDSQDVQIDSLRAENLALRDEVNTLKTAAADAIEQSKQMIEHVSAVHDWIEGGAKPPPPLRPPWAPLRYGIK